MDWNNLRYVLALARAGTTAAAARRLGVDQTTVARRLAAAEAALGVRLFERASGVFRPTRAGMKAIEAAARVEAQVEALGSPGPDDGADAAGLVRLSAVPIVANRLLVPNLRQLHAAHPRIRLELIAESRSVSLLRREADIALRLARPEHGGATLAKRIGSLDYAVYAKRGSDAATMPWIVYEEGSRHLPQARWLAAAARADRVAALLVNDAEAIIHAIRIGLGKSLLPRRIADQDGRLERLPREVDLIREVWLLTHHEIRQQGAIAAVVDWVVDLFAEPS